MSGPTNDLVSLVNDPYVLLFPLVLSDWRVFLACRLSDNESERIVPPDWVLAFGSG